MLRPFCMNLVHASFAEGLNDFSNSENVACLPAVFLPLQLQLLCSYGFSFTSHETLHICFVGSSRSLSHSLFLSLCVFLLRNARHHLPGQDVPQYGRWWRRRPSSLPPLRVAISSSPFVLFCLLCCRHLRNWRSCWHAITFVLPSRRSSSRIREWLRILHMIILCRNC